MVNSCNSLVINWVKQVGELLPDAYDPETTPEVGELDELETFVGSKKTALLKIQNNVEALNQIINSLFEIQRCAYSLPIHPLIQQRPSF